MTLLTIERVAALRRVPLFAAVPDHVLAGLARVAREVEVAAGDEVIRIDDADDWMLVVVHGTLRVHADDRTLAELGPGGTVGELSILVPDRRSASVTATSDGLLLRIDQPMFDELMTDHPEIARSAIEALVALVRARTPGAPAS
jgi:CRP-like cAMP-binding protein